MVNGVGLEELEKLSHINLTNLRGRQVYLCPIWTGNEWKLWVPTDEGTLFEMKPVEMELGVYLTMGDPAKEDDLFFGLFEFTIQTLSFPKLHGLIKAIEDDFHLLAVRAAKLQHFFVHQDLIDQNIASSFIRTELECILTTARSMIDLSYEIFRVTWDDYVQLLDKDANALKAQNRLPRKLTKFAMPRGEITSSDKICSKYAIPDQVAKLCLMHLGFFDELRSLRDDIVHGTNSTGHIFLVEEGFAVSPTEKPFDRFDWREFHYVNENLVSLKPWVARIILQTFEACTKIVCSLDGVVDFGGKIFPEYQVRVRDHSNTSLVDLLNSISNDENIARSSAFWKKKATLLPE